jgi:hypothetical protein
VRSAFLSLDRHRDTQEDRGGQTAPSSTCMLNQMCCRTKTDATVHCKFNDFPCWKALLKIKDTYMACRKVNLKNGNICRLWKDPIDEGNPLCDKFPIFLTFTLIKIVQLRWF